MYDNVQLIFDRLAAQQRNYRNKLIPPETSLPPSLHNVYYNLRMRLEGMFQFTAYSDFIIFLTL